MSDDVPNKSGKGVDKHDKLDEKTAYEKYENQGYTYGQIAEEHDVSISTVRRRVEAYKEGMKDKEKEVQQNPEAYGLRHEVDDSETESPYGTDCPACNSEIPKPDTPGVHPCPECGTNLKYNESEL